MGRDFFPHSFFLLPITAGRATLAAKHAGARPTERQRRSQLFSIEGKNQNRLDFNVILAQTPDLLVSPVTMIAEFMK